MNDCNGDAKKFEELIIQKLQTSSIIHIGCRERTIVAEQVKESRLNEFLENPERSLWSIAIPVIAGMAIQTFYSNSVHAFHWTAWRKFNCSCSLQHATLLSL